MPDFKNIKLRPMTGHFDTLSSNDEIGFGNWKIIKNAVTRSTRNRQRAGGWRRLFADDDPYNNQDLHDQLVDHLGYYDAFLGHTAGGGDLSGYSYTYFTGSYLSPSTFAYGPLSGPFAPVYIGDFPELFYGPCPIFYPYVGYPYRFIYAPNQAADPALTTGYPGYYLESYVYTSCQSEYPGDLQPGYPYGPSFPVYEPQFSYDYTYCGTYLYNRPGCREAVTMLNEVVTTNGRKLIAATMSRVYELNQSSGNWRVLADGLGNPGYTVEQCGCNTVRGVSATLGSYLIFTNNFDPPSIYLLGDEPADCTMQSLLPITDLDALGISRAGGVVTWKGFVIFFDITEGGERMGGTVLWSDLEDPNSYIESDTSFAGRATVAVGETILAAAPLGNWLILYTDKSIIRVSLVGGEDVFNFEEIYRGGNALKYKYSLINGGDLHVYLGESDVYVFTQFDTRPINVDWVTKASGMIFEGITEDDASYLSINKDACDLVTGGWNEEKREAWLSWPTGDNICPNVTLRFNFKFSAADFIDHGWTAFITFHRDLRPTVGEWIEDMGICPRGSVVATGARDGEVCAVGDEVANPPRYIRNPTENADLPIHADSVCARLEGRSLDDFCTDCASPATFITASAVDFTLKQQEDDIYYRERLSVLGQICEDISYATEEGQAEGFAGSVFALDTWVPLTSQHCSRLNSITGYQIQEDMPLNNAVYDSTRDVIFAVRGGFIFKMNATTGARITYARYNFPSWGDDTYVTYAANVGKLYATAWYDPRDMSFATPRQGIVKINPDTLAVENFVSTAGLENDLSSGPFSLIYNNALIYLIYKNALGKSISVYIYDPTTDTLGSNVNVDGADNLSDSQLVAKTSDNSISVVTRTRVRNYTSALVFNFFTAAFTDATRQGFGVAHDLVNDQYYVATDSSHVFKVAASSGAVSASIDTGVSTARPRRIYWNSVDGKIYVPGWQSDSVIIINPAAADAVSVQTGFDSPYDIVFTPTKKWAVQHGLRGLKEIA